MESKITIKYSEKFENNNFLYSKNYDLSNVIDLKNLHDLFKSGRYVSNAIIIERKINDEKIILYRLINGILANSQIIFLNSFINHENYDVMMESVLDINDLIINIVNFTVISDMDKTLDMITEVIDEYEESKKTKKLILF